MRSTVSARIFDPLWLIARQWQVGEFQGEDSGTPVLARLRAKTAMISRCHLGEVKANTSTRAAAYDPESMPLEVLIERRRIRPLNATEPRMLRLRVEAGLHFLRMLELQPLSRSYRAAFVNRYALRPIAPQSIQTFDEGTARFVQTMVGRAPDGQRLEEIFRSGPSGQVVIETALEIADADRAEVEQTANRWLAWYAMLFGEPGPEAASAWMPPRLEYVATVAGRLSEAPGDEKALTTSEFYEGHLDWSDFDIDHLEVNLGTDGDRRFSSITETIVPAPVSFRGVPAARFWEFEDAQIDYGLLSAGPADLAQMLISEYVSSYGNDWFVLPLTLKVGSLTAVNSLVVSDTFGVRTLLRPIGDRALPNPFWSMFQLAYLRRPGTDGLPGAETNLFLLPPTLGRSLESAPMEEVLFARDENANLAWAIERSIESPVEQPMMRADAPPLSTDQVDAPRLHGEARYRLSSTVPAHWIPLLPVQLVIAPGKIVSRLKRGAVLQPDGSQAVHQAQGEILNSGEELLLHDEEIPREGIRVGRHYQMARWTDGSAWAWAAYRKQVGFGESSSGLRFDSILTEDEGNS
jgi:hypothetical protein